MKQAVATILRDTIAEHPGLAPLRARIAGAFSILAACFRSGNKLLVCGNGGSAADAEHIVGELMNRFAFRRPLPAAHVKLLKHVAGRHAGKLVSTLQPGLPAISLVSQASLITAVANDLSADVVFAQQVYGYGRPGDALLALSTSGNSANVLNAALVARALKMKTVGLSGGRGGRLRDLCDVCILAPGTTTFRVQELHQVIYHALCGMLEQEFFAGGRGLLR